LLGIGIPSVFIVKSPSEINAGAYALDDDRDVIIITSALYERVSLGELQTIIGHECGHIHNNHGIFELAAQVLVDGLLESTWLGAKAGGFDTIAGPALNLLSLPLKLALENWSRAAEVTCDRAGIICADSIDDAIAVQAKLLSGAPLGANSFNIKPILKQYDTLRKTPVKYLELDDSHPITARRILADLEFMHSEVLYNWRPEWKPVEEELLSKEDLDERTHKFISVIKSSKREKGI
jgi:Zn-dependent protease with chaperone function